VGDQDAVFIGCPLRLGQQAPMGHKFLALVDPKNDISIADIDR
jgi:hypothetical protein